MFSRVLTLVLKTFFYIYLNIYVIIEAISDSERAKGEQLFSSKKEDKLSNLLRNEQKKICKYFKMQISSW